MGATEGTMGVDNNKDNASEFNQSFLEAAAGSLCYPGRIEVQYDFVL